MVKIVHECISFGFCQISVHVLLPVIPLQHKHFYCRHFLSLCDSSEINFIVKWWCDHRFMSGFCPVHTIKNLKLNFLLDVKGDASNWAGQSSMVFWRIPTTEAVFFCPTGCRVQTLRLTWQAAEPGRAPPTLSLTHAVWDWVEEGEALCPQTAAPLKPQWWLRYVLVISSNVNRCVLPQLANIYHS